MSNEERSSELQAKVLAGRLLTLSAGRSTEALDRFSGWLLAGFGATFALMLANTDKLSTYLSPRDLGTAIALFLFAVVLGVLARYLGSVVGASASIAGEAEVIGRRLVDDEIAVNVKTLFRECERAALWPARSLLHRTLARVEAGDFAAAGRLAAVLAQVHAYLVVGETFSAAGALGIVAYALAV